MWHHGTVEDMDHVFAEDFVDHQPSGKEIRGRLPCGQQQIAFQGVNIFRVAGGKITDRGTLQDQEGLLKQLEGVDA
jgi:hypothetical protein